MHSRISRLVLKMSLERPLKLFEQNVVENIAPMNLRSFVIVMESKKSSQLHIHLNKMVCQKRRIEQSLTWFVVC